MSLVVLDGNGTSQTLKTSTSVGELVPHHNVDAVAGTVAATQSGGWTVSVTGTVPAIVPGTAATNLGKAEDAAHVTGDTGVFVLAVRSDTPATKTNVDGDYHPLLVDSTGRLHSNAIANGDGVGVAGAVLSAKRAFAGIAASTTDGAIVAAVATKKIRVLGLALVCGGTATTIVLTSKPGGAGASISATFSLGVNGVLVLPSEACGWFETVAGEGLSATTGAGSTVAVQVLYAEV